MVEEIPEQEVQNESVSSTKIRKALSEGNIQRANAYLEHLFLMQVYLVYAPLASATYEHPSLLVQLDDPDKLFPPDGAYAVSYLFRTFTGKGLVVVKNSTSILLPLETNNFLDGDECTIRFHKQMVFEEWRALISVLEAVRELIY